MLVTNFERLQTEEGAPELLKLMERHHITHAWVGNPHPPDYFDQPTLLDDVLLEDAGIGKGFEWVDSTFAQYFAGRGDQVLHVGTFWDGDSGLPFSKNGLGCVADISTYREQHSWSLRDKTVAQGLGATHPQKSHQCLFVCDSDRADGSCRQGPLVEIAKRMVASTSRRLS